MHVPLGPPDPDSQRVQSFGGSIKWYNFFSKFFSNMEQKSASRTCGTGP